jgi:protease-4
VRDWKREGATERLGLWTAAASLARVAGLPNLAILLDQTADAVETARLDGLLAVWHPALQK